MIPISSRFAFSLKSQTDSGYSTLISLPCRCSTKFVSTTRHEQGANLFRRLHVDVWMAARITSARCMDLVTWVAMSDIFDSLEESDIFNLLGTSDIFGLLETSDIFGLLATSDILDLLRKCRVDPVHVFPSTSIANADSNNTTNIIFVKRIHETTRGRTLTFRLRK